MKRKCAWCNQEIGQKESIHKSEAAITHGICEECTKKVLLELGEDLSDFLDSLKAPIVLVDKMGTIKTANKQAQTFFEKDLSQIEGFKGGEVFECMYAELPEGCGNTIHCSGCTIRNTVMDTFQTGKCNINIPAYLNTKTSDDYTKIAYFISTERVAGIVLLRIDKDRDISC